MVRSAFIFMITLLTFTFSAAAAEEPAPLEERSDAAEIAAAESAVDLVVVRVSGDPISEKQVLDEINRLAGQENLNLEQSQQRNLTFFDKAVENLVTLSLMKAWARDMNVTVDNAAVDARIQQMLRSYPSQEAFQEALAAQGATEAELRNNIRTLILVQEFMNEASKAAAGVTEAEVEQFYAGNPGKFALPERARAAHILSLIPPGATAAQKEEIRKKLESVRVDIEADVITFADAAAKYSQDANTAAQGGEMGFVTRDNIPKSFADILFRIKPGTVTPALESQAGYHILVVLELKPAGQAALEDVRSSLRQSLEQSAKQSAGQKFTEELKSKASIEYFMTAEGFNNRRR